MGGINQTDYYCTLVALTDVEKYCKKYEVSKQCAAKKRLNEIDTVVPGQQTKRKKRSFRKLQVDDLNSEDLSIVSTKLNMPDGSKKRKRRTQFELLQSYQFYTDVTEDENYKCMETSFSSDGDDQPLTAELVMSDINSNIIDSQNASPKKLNEDKFNYDTFDLPYSDENNNSSGSIEPRSPTLLLKRSQNNKWHIAKAALPHLNFEDTTSEKASDIVIETNDSKTSAESKTAMTKVKNKLQAPKMPLTTASKKSSGKNTKKDEGVQPSIRKLGKKSQKTVSESNKKRKSSTNTVDEHKSVELEECPITNKDNIGAKSENTDNTSEQSIQHKNPDGRKRPLLLKDSTSLVKDSTDSLNKTVVVNKEKQENSTKSDKVVKKKRKRRVEMNTFRLVETIPYPSSLVVKDGDLCPAYTMAYNQTNYLPGCCHALWRWRLGKPVKIPSQSPVKTPDDMSLMENKQLHDRSQPRANENYRFPHNTEQDEHSQDERRPDETPPVENILDEQSHVESLPDENSPDKQADIDISLVHSQQDDDLLFKEKNDDLSSITITQDGE